MTELNRGDDSLAAVRPIYLPMCASGLLFEVQSVVDGLMFAQESLTVARLKAC